jgi:hypothetical protein
MKIAQILIKKVPLVNNEVLVHLKNIESRVITFKITQVYLSIDK